MSEIHLFDLSCHFRIKLRVHTILWCYYIEVWLYSNYNVLITDLDYKTFLKDVLDVLINLRGNSARLLVHYFFSTRRLKQKKCFISRYIHVYTYIGQCSLEKNYRLIFMPALNCIGKSWLRWYICVLFDALQWLCLPSLRNKRYINI